MKPVSGIGVVVALAVLVTIAAADEAVPSGDGLEKDTAGVSASEVDRFYEESRRQTHNLTDLMSNYTLSPQPVIQEAIVDKKDSNLLNQTNFTEDSSSGTHNNKKSSNKDDSLQNSSNKTNSTNGSNFHTPNHKPNFNTNPNIQSEVELIKNRKAPRVGDSGIQKATNEPTENQARDRSGRSFWSSAEDTTEVPATDTTEQEPEELPEPAALAIPVPSFLANLFSSSTPQEPPRPPRSRLSMDHRMGRRPDHLGRQPTSRGHQLRQHRPRQGQRRVYRQRQPPSIYQDHTEVDHLPPRTLPVRRTSLSDYRIYPEELLPDYEHSSHSNHISINTKYDFITEAPYSARRPSLKSQILDSTVFSIPPSSQLDEDPHRSFVKRPDRSEFGSAVNYDDVRFDMMDRKQHTKSTTHEYVDEYGDDQNLYEDEYHYDNSYKRESVQGGRRRNLKEDGRDGIEEFFSSVPSLNPLNFFRSSEQTMDPEHLPSPARPNRRRGHHLVHPTRRIQFERQPPSHEVVTENPAFTDYIDFSELEPFYSNEKKRPDRRRQRFKTNLPPGVGHLEPASPRRRNSYNSMHGVRFRGSFPSISHEKVIFDQNNPSRRHNKYEHHSLDDFIVNIPSNEVQFEEVPIVEEDPRLEAFKFKEDYPLREDLYVGKDGNIYLQDPNERSKTATATTDSDDFFGLHMYGMDQPLYQEVPVPLTRHVTYMSGEDAPRGADLSQLADTNKKHLVDASENRMEKFEVTPPRRSTSLNGREGPRLSKTDEELPQPSATPRFPASGGKTPYVSDFAKSLLKVQSSRDRRTSSLQEDRLAGFRRMKD